MSLEYNGNLIPSARVLRKNATPQEKHLWYDFLHDYPVRFQRQKTIESFIVDFYCHKAKLVIELDGSQHYTDQAIAADAERTNKLLRYDIKVIRFSNEEVDKHFEIVCQQIDEEVKKRIDELLW